MESSLLLLTTPISPPGPDWNPGEPAPTPGFCGGGEFGALRVGSGGTLGSTRARIRTREERLKFAVLRHGILVFFTKVASLNENLDTRRKAAILQLVEADGSRVLLASKHELELFLPLGLKTPGRQGRQHKNGHDGQRDQQGGHRVATLSVLTP